jgi:hypothetical protein
MTKINKGGGQPPEPSAAKAVGRPCTVCLHPDRTAIEVELVEGTLAVAISRRFDINKQAIMRHRDNHMAVAALVEGAQAVAEEEAIQRASSLLKTAEAILSEARAEGDKAMALQAIREASRVVLVLAKMSGDIDTSTQINVTFAPVMIELQAVVMAALANHPQAKADVVRAMSALSGNGPLLIEG